MTVAAQGRRSCCYMAAAVTARNGMLPAMSGASKTSSPSLPLTCAAMARVACQLTPQTTPHTKWVRARLDWPAIGPADFRCPTLWLVGSEDRLVMASLKEYEDSLKGSRVQFHMVEGLGHEQVFEEIDRVFPTLLAFTQR